MSKILSFVKKASLFSFLLFISCINNPVSPLYTQDKNNNSVDVDKLYEEFKRKNKEEYLEKMRNKKKDTFNNINFSINTGLQKQDSNNFSIKSVNLN
ncbi:MAG: hypothetical protein AABZ74_13205 [Cyanobacteriota bacterium]